LYFLVDEQLARLKHVVGKVAKEQKDLVTDCGVIGKCFGVSNSANNTP
jgi:hypothetical protein